MATLSIVRPGQDWPTGDRRPRHRSHVPRQPVAKLKAGGVVLELPFAPRGTTLDGWAGAWTVQPRPGRSALVTLDGDGVPTMSLTVTLAHRDHQHDVEGMLKRLRKIAEGGDRVIVVNLSPAERGPWRLSGVTVTGELRQAGTNLITRATVALTFLAAVDAHPRLGPVHGGKKKKQHNRNPKKAQRYTIRKGDTLRALADRFYGEPGDWKRIARRNNIKNPRALKVGRVIVIPPDDKDVGYGRA